MVSNNEQLEKLLNEIKNLRKYIQDAEQGLKNVANKLQKTYKEYKNEDSGQSELPEGGGEKPPPHQPPPPQ